MATPLITFKAGRCEYDPQTGKSVTPEPTTGYVYITQEDELHRFCWRSRSAPHTEPDLELFILPTDAKFTPYRPEGYGRKVGGRVFVLKFSSSSDRHFFWMQSKARSNDPSEFSQRDLKIGEIVNSILQGEEIDVNGEMRNIPAAGAEGDSDDDDDDTAMEDVDGPGSLRRAASGGAGAGATGGDIREEGEESREGGADGGRAVAPSTNPTDQTQAAVANFLRSLQGTNLSQQSSQQSQQQQFTTLPDLLSTSTTLNTLSNLPSSNLDNLLSHLPPSILLLSSGLTTDEISNTELNDSETLSAITLSLPDTLKREILAKVLRSAQFHQACASLTHALRDGGLPMIAGTLGVRLRNGGLVEGGNVPLGAGAAVAAFVQGVRDGVLADESESGAGVDADTDRAVQGGDDVDMS